MCHSAAEMLEAGGRNDAVPFQAGPLRWQRAWRLERSLFRAGHGAPTVDIGHSSFQWQGDVCRKH